MPDYRDYGAISGAPAPENFEIDKERRTQVYIATHDGQGKSLPYWGRAFISFSYNGKNIEDFGLISVTEANSLNRQAYASFTDNVTASNIYDGQLYWSTHYGNNSLEFTLATDGITEGQLNNFQQWFKPGQEKELILTEHPNRAIIARVSAPPQLDLLPFEGSNIVKIANIEHRVKTTLYKGQIKLSFIMDEPFWYARRNILDNLQQDDTYAAGEWSDANNTSVSILSSDDALKILQEDHVPFSDMLTYNGYVPMLFGNERTIEIDLSGEGAIVGYAQVGQSIIGYTIKNGNAGLTLSQSAGIINPGYFYYAGNAPCTPILKFSLTPIIDEDTKFITCPCNSFTNTERPFNTITIESQTKQTFKFTTPSIYTAYNQVISILSTIGEGVVWETVRERLRDCVKHYAARAYAISVIDHTLDLGETTTNAKLEAIINEMPKFLYREDEGIDATPASVIFTFDSKLGSATAVISYRRNYSKNSYLTEVAENVGDMVRSNYLIITDRNTFSEDGYIRPSIPSHPEYSHKIYTDVEGGLTNVSLIYKYMYM